MIRAPMGLANAELVVNTLRLASISLIVMLVNYIKDVIPRCTVVGLRQAIQHLLKVVPHSSFYSSDHRVITDFLKQLSGGGFDFRPLLLCRKLALNKFMIEFEDRLVDYI